MPAPAGCRRRYRTLPPVPAGSHHRRSVLSPPPVLAPSSVRFLSTATGTAVIVAGPHRCCLRRRLRRLSLPPASSSIRYLATAAGSVIAAAGPTRRRYRTRAPSREPETSYA
ncbi:hypothetical protein GUJ93_ZPchr0003g18145 [Zizania palustris]|uniref:Uncharacterized protein n=1 Tax=Zizania palustris TaxID=103762 RepID=A0A8J5VW90_ZIZPA|nr:hypothetical protein GUJ93_ZPchr0003g18145 [Zizania palustris]